MCCRGAQVGVLMRQEVHVCQGVRRPVLDLRAQCSQKVPH